MVLAYKSKTFKKKKEKIINTFLRKGNMEDYKNDFPEKQCVEKTEEPPRQ